MSAGAESEFEAPVGYHVQRRRHLRHECRVAVVVTQHQRVEGDVVGEAGDS